MSFIYDDESDPYDGGWEEAEEAGEGMEDWLLNGAAPDDSAFEPPN